MWLERLKTVALFFLVAASIYLSLLLWQGLPPPESPVGGLPSGGTYWGAGRAPVELLAPARIVLHRGQGGTTVLYPGSAPFDQAWKQALDLLQQLGSLNSEKLKGKDCSRSDWEAGVEGLALELVFSLPLETEIWGPALEYPPGFTFPWPVKRVLFSPGTETVLLFTSAKADKFLGYELPPAAGNLEATLRELADADLMPYRELGESLPVQGKVYVPAQPILLPLLKPFREKVDPEVVAGSFFADLSLTRRIRERDGATIYTDGRRGVRVRSEGGVEYTAPEVAAGVPLPAAQALERAARFITQHGGWPEEARLSSFAEVPGPPGKASYRLVFDQYWNGLPLFAPVLHLDLSDRGVASFRREVVRAVDRAGWVKVDAAKLERELSAGRKLTKGEEITDVYLAYREENEPEGQALLRPVWVVETSAGHRLCIDAGGGERP